MAKWIATITNAGTALLNSQVSGADLVIVGAVSSSTETAAEELAKLTEMTNIKQDLTIGSVAVDSNNSTFSIPIVLSNDNLEVSYALKQIGIYAQDPTNTENKILFAVAQIDVARVINLPADAPGYKLEIDLNFQNTNNSNVVIQVTDESLKRQMEELGNRKMDIVNPTFSGNMSNAEFTIFPYNIKGVYRPTYSTTTYLYSKAYFTTMPTNYSAKSLSVPEGEIYIPLKSTSNSFYNTSSEDADTVISNSKSYYGVNVKAILETNGVQYVTTLVGFEKVHYYNSQYNVYAILKVPENFPYSNDGRTCSLIAMSANNVTIDGNVLFGENNTLTHKNCALFGNNLQGKGYQVNMGHYNDYYNVTNGSSSGTSGTALCIGNGTSSTRANAFRVDYSGTIYAKSSTVSTGADYSEYFEWLDGNEENEDRVGYFVTFEDKQKIRKANATDDYILGIVSGLPCIVGNGDECWRGRYILDEFGRFIEETFEYEEIIDGKSVTRIGTKYKENPDYNPNQEYVERAKRKEWSAIGMIGVLSVYDDGTCQENGYCTVSDGGIATACESGSINTYRVLERVTENIVKVLFR